MSHKIKFIARSRYDHTWRCDTCGAGPKNARGEPLAEGFRTSQMAQDDANKHLAYIERIDRLVHKGSQTLQQAHDYYLEQAQNTALPAKDRALWQQLADETGHRLGVGVKVEQPELFTL